MNPVHILFLFAHPDEKDKSGLKSCQLLGVHDSPESAKSQLKDEIKNRNIPVSYFEIKKEKVR